jgi:hypothetical protein
MPKALALSRRPPIDDFEAMIVRAFRPVSAVAAIWVREVPFPVPEGRGKRFGRIVWLQLDRVSSGVLVELQRLAKELQIRAIAEPFWFEAEWTLDYPPSDIAPACIFERGLASASEST